MIITLRGIFLTLLSFTSYKYNIPSITNPFSILGSMTCMKGGANGKFSGKMRCSRICGMRNSLRSEASSLSGSIWCRRTCHSNKLSFTSSTWNKSLQMKMFLYFKVNSDILSEILLSFWDLLIILNAINLTHSTLFLARYPSVTSW